MSFFLRHVNMEWEVKYTGGGQKKVPPMKFGTFLSFHQKWGKMLRVSAIPLVLGVIE